MECESGSIEEFRADKILNSLNEIGVDHKVARDVIERVQYRLHKLGPPVPKAAIKKAIIKELETENPEAAKIIKKSKIWT